MNDSVVSVHGLSVTFPGVKALSGVSLDVLPGECLGLIGENGAGKSTLIKVLAGINRVYDGRVEVGGVPCSFAGPRDSQERGISVVHQELSLVDEMSVAENLLLGCEPGGRFRVDTDGLIAQARDVLRRLGPVGRVLEDRVDLEGPIGHVGVGDQQLVEIAKAIHRDAKLIILDEPTAALSQREAEALFGLLRERRAAGTAFLYVSHRLPEVVDLSDRVAVLRDGKLVGPPEPPVSEAVLVQQMTGRTVREERPKRPLPGQPRLRVRDLTLDAALRGVSLEVRAGEIVGVAGSVGAGRTALLSSLFGLARGTLSGEVSIDAASYVPCSPTESLNRGLFLLPEDRKAEGVSLSMSVEENVHLSSLGTRWVDAVRLEQLAVAATQLFQVKAASIHQSVATLSGGNQQKVAMARGLATEPRVWLLDEPTRGVDIGARAEMYELIRAQADRGGAVLFASSDLAELRQLADRILVMRDGRIVGERSFEDAEEEWIVGLSVGARVAA